MQKGKTHVLVVDNYDSFTYNLVHLLEQTNAEVTVMRNDEIDLDSVGQFSHILISPGPGLPSEAGVTMEILSKYSSVKPIFGVCLGMQAMISAAGAEMNNMSLVKHGAQESVTILENSALFKALPKSMRVGRYHSWAFKPENVPVEFRVTAVSEDGFVMAVEHQKLRLTGVQFHPESIMTDHGLQIIDNWLSATKD